MAAMSFIPCALRSDTPTRVRDTGRRDLPPCPQRGDTLTKLFSANQVMQIGCESLTGDHDDQGQSGREDLNLRLQGSESTVLRPFCRVPPDGSSNVSTASSATDHALRLPTPETDRRGDLPCFLGREPLPHPKRCG